MYHSFSEAPGTQIAERAAKMLATEWARSNSRKVIYDSNQGFSQDEKIGSPKNFLGIKIMRSTNFDVPSAANSYGFPVIVTDLSPNYGITERAEKITVFGENPNFCCKKSSSGSLNCYVFGIVGKLFENVREW